MTKEQKRIVARFRRLVKDAKSAGLMVVADSGEACVRFLTSDEYGDGSKLPGCGEAVDVHDACGGDTPKYSGDACNSAYY